MDDREISFTDALAQIESIATPVEESEYLPLDQLLRRVLAQDIVSERDVPAHTNSAVDGFAFAFEDYEKHSGRLRWQGFGRAGREAERLVADTARRISTGAPLSIGADTVAFQEKCYWQSDSGDTGFVDIAPGLKKGSNVRFIGEDLKAGSRVFCKGSRLAAQHLASLASMGFSQAPVFRRLKIGILSCGDELHRLRPADHRSQPVAEVQPHIVFDANFPMLSALLSDFPVDVVDLGVSTDQRDDLLELLESGIHRCDALITTASASVGVFDHMAEILARIGQVIFRGIAIKPGRPFTLGRVENIPVFALPGNPVAVMVCFQMCLRRAIMKMCAGQTAQFRGISMEANFEHDSRPGRWEFLRGSTNQANLRRIDRFPDDGSGLIRSLRESDGLIAIEAEVETVRSGDSVMYYPYL